MSTNNPGAAYPHGPRPPTGETDESTCHTQFYVPSVPPVPPDDARPPAELELPLAIDQYLLVEEVARGGMGVIYRGRDLCFLRDLAVKVLLPAHAQREELRRRARTEAYITAQLEHPGVVPVYAVGHLPDGRPYFGMRLVRGQTLAELIRDHPDPQASLPRLLKVFEQVCHTLAFAHSRRVVHRDVKPANVLVAPFGVVKVIDWGVAKVLAGSPVERDGPPADPLVDLISDPGQGNTRHGAVVGTVEYMAPEQVRGEADRVDARADVFALGGVLCHLLTGQPPYTGGSFYQVLDRATAADLTDAHARLAGCGADPPLVRLARWCLSTTPDDRPADAGVVAGALTTYLEDSLRQAERDMARFFELSLDLFCIAGMDGYFKRVNDNFSRVLGFSTADILRLPFRHFIHPDDLPATEAVIRQLQDGRPVVRFRNRFRDIRGDYRQFEWTGKSVPEEGLMFAVARDVTPTYQE